MSASDIAIIMAAVGVLLSTLVGLGIQIATFVLAQKNRADVVEIKADIKTVEIATNSMKDALVKAKGEAEFARGGQEERDKRVAASAETTVALAKGLIEVTDAKRG